MLAWQKLGNGETPESSGLKGDHLVGKYYVAFDKQYKSEMADLKSKGATDEEAEKNAPSMKEAQEMLRKWEANDKEVRELWTMMNGWVYKGFAETYKMLGVKFDSTYYESNTYLLGKEIIDTGLEKGVLKVREDKSIYIDLTADGLDEKTLLRSDGTSVYMTQDLGTALQRQKEVHFKKLIYTVGNEQDYHFKVLFLILKKLGFEWADGLQHLSYGMVELPEGKMKSREGTVVDADDLMQEMINTAAATTKELGKVEGLTEDEANHLYQTIGLGALKYFMLKVDPKKKMLFNPSESIDFNGNTAPFIQFNYVRIQALIRKATESGQFDDKKIFPEIVLLSAKEKELIMKLYTFDTVLQQAALDLSPALIANYVYDLAKEFSQYYHETPILKEENKELILFRLQLSKTIGIAIKTGMSLLGIEVPERM
jgi:arginyl-tRNA synthetase